MPQKNDVYNLDSGTAVYDILKFYWLNHKKYLRRRRYWKIICCEILMLCNWPKTTKGSEKGPSGG